MRPTAREYIAELARVTKRPLKFHPKMPKLLYVDELGKWVIKLVGGKKAPAPSLRDIESRGLKANFDCGDVKRDLGWSPVSDPAIFYGAAFKASAVE